MAHRFDVAGESSAHVVPRGYTRPRTASTASSASLSPSEILAGRLQNRSPAQRPSSREDPDGEHEDEFSQKCRLKARWINIAICFGIELHNVFKFGMRFSLTGDNESDSDMDDDEKTIYSTAYQRILEFIPGLKKFLLVNGDSDPAKLYKLIEGIQKGCNNARSDTFKRVNQFTDRYLNSGPSPIQCDARTMAKASRGLNHPKMGRLIIPAAYVSEWDENPERSRANFNSGCNQIMGYDMPVFLYYEYKYDPEDPDKGLFRSGFLVCILVDILYGPQAVDTEGAKRSENYRHHCVGDMYDAEAITPPMIAYSAVVARFALSSRRIWNYKEDNFDYRTFYRAIIMRLSDTSDPWVKELFGWWNIQIFGNEEGKKSVVNKDNREREEWEKFVQRKAVRKALSAAAALNRAALSTRASTPDPFEQPIDEDEEQAVTPSPLVDPTLVRHLHERQPQHASPPPPSSVACVIDPALLNMAASNNPNFTQAHNAMPVEPNTSISNRERESSPLSNPPGELSSTETTCAPSSYPRKRKATRNDTGKGKTISKQRKKTAQGSQSRSGRD